MTLTVNTVATIIIVIMMVIVAERIIVGITIITAAKTDIIRCRNVRRIR